MSPVLLLAALCFLQSQHPSTEFHNPAKPGRRWSTVERLASEHLSAVHDARLRFAANRKNLPANAIYQDYRAVLHVPAQDAAHSKGTREQALAGAKEAGVRIVGLSDHGGPNRETWRGLRDGVLFIPGAELDHQLVISFLDGDLRFLSHFEERPNSTVVENDGIEIYNRHTGARDEPEFERYFQSARADREQWRKLVRQTAAFPDEVFAAGGDDWPPIFAQWDHDIQSHPLTGIAANDAHHNQVYDGIDFDSYALSFRNVSTHILARDLTEPDVRQSLRDGHVYVSHDWLADPTGFSFVAVNNLGVFNIGDSMPFLGATRISAQFPLEAKLKLIRNGAVVEEAVASALNFTAREPGAYRIEAWLGVDGEERPWIYSNPIYLNRLTAPLTLPSAELAPGVETRKDIVYTPGKPEDEGKHKLDLYLPKDKKNFTVLFFIHGGAWRSGDRSRYAALGNRFARAGIGTVIISYRLAPQNPHPAQIEDAAAAFAWVVKKIEQYGGDPKRIFAGGHSAGGHLTALLTLDPRYLAAHGLSAASIHGAMALSGVYSIHGLESVFGSDADKQKAASPLSYVKAPAPPFLVTYCEWDYPTLPGQAKEFYVALRTAGILARLMYVPKQSHISEIVNVLKDDDITARAMLDFMSR